MNYSFGGFLTIIYLAALLFCLLAALYYRKAMKSRGLTVFIPYMVYVFAQEVTVNIYLLEYPKASTAIIYNLYRLLCVCFFGRFYHQIPFNSPSRPLIKILCGIYILAWIITFGFIQSLFTFNNYINLSGGLVITSFALFFLFNYFKLDNRTEEKKWVPVIWITVGIVVFYPVINICFSLYKYLAASKAYVFGVPIYQLIPRFMSFFLYGCFIRAFYLCQKKNWT